MPKSEMFTQDEIFIIQTRQLRKTVHYAYQRSPFYRDLMDREQINPAAIKTLEDLKFLPTVTRADLEREGDRFLCVRPEEVADVLLTAGTEGRPLPVKLTEADLARLGYNQQLSLMVAGIHDRDVVAIAAACGQAAMTGMAFYLGLRRVGSTAVRLSGLPEDRFLHWMKESKATVVVGTPAWLKALVLQAEKTGFPLPASGVKKLICVGQEVRGRDLALNPVGQFLGRAWNAQLFSTFGVTELATAFIECEEGGGAHIHPELAHVEIVDDQGRPLPEGQVGEICITPFGISGMPLIRYRTGDYSFLRSGRCRCERYTHRLGPILGRKSQQIHSDGRSFFTAELTALIQSEPQVRNFVLIAEHDRQGRDQLRLKFHSAEAGLAPRLQEQVWQQTRIPLEAQPASAEEILHLQHTGENLQPLLFIDRRSRV